MRDIDQVMDEAIDLAKRQLEAARTLDAEVLTEATTQRADLVFEMQVIRAAEAGADPDPQRVETLRAIDRRLVRVLQSASTALRAGVGQQGATTYDPRGQLKEAS